MPNFENIVWFGICTSFIILKYDMGFSRGWFGRLIILKSDMGFVRVGWVDYYFNKFFFLNFLKKKNLKRKGVK